MAVAVFDYGVWALRYPDLAASVASPLAQSYFGDAGLYLDNTDCSPVQDVNARLSLLNMIVAHIASLGIGSRGGAGGLVGPIESATEGSVTVKVKLPDAKGLAWWFMQTPYGAAVWAALAPYRTAHYVPGLQPDFGPYGYTGGFGQGWGIPTYPGQG